MLRGSSYTGGGGGGIGLPASGVLKQSAIISSVTGTTSETVLATIAIPAGTLGINGAIKLRAIWSTTATLGTWQPQVKLAGSTMQNPGVQANTNKFYWTEWIIYNRGVLNSQVRINAQSPNQPNTTAPSLQSIDFSIAQNLTLTGTLSNAGDTMQLDAYTVEILNP